MPEDQLKTIPGFSAYKISPDGKKVFSTLRNKFLKFYPEVNGYLTVCLKNDQGVFKKVGVHRLVARTFLDNPNNFRCVNHRSLDKQDNRVENIEYCSASYNNRHATEALSEEPGQMKRGERYYSPSLRSNLVTRRDMKKAAIAKGEAHGKFIGEYEASDGFKTKTLRDMARHLKISHTSVARRVGYGDIKLNRKRPLLKPAK